MIDKLKKTDRAKRAVEGVLSDAVRVVNDPRRIDRFLEVGVDGKLFLTTENRKAKQVGLASCYDQPASKRDVREWIFEELAEMFNRRLFDLRDTDTQEFVRHAEPAEVLEAFAGDGTVLSCGKRCEVDF